MAISGNLTLVISARINDGQAHDIGEIELPVVTETTHSVGAVSITARVRVDEVEMKRRLQDFSAAVTDELAASVAPNVLQYSPDRMLGPALSIDPSPEFETALKQAKARQAEMDASNILDGPEHVIIGARQEGKTRLALKWLLEAPAGVERVLIVTDGNQADHLKSVYELPKNDPRIISYRTLLNKGPRPGVEYGVDETVHILTALLGLKDMPRLLTVGHAEAWQGRKKKRAVWVQEALVFAEAGRRVAIIEPKAQEAHDRFNEFMEVLDQGQVARVTRVSGYQGIDFHSGGFLKFFSDRSTRVRQHTLDRVYVSAALGEELAASFGPLVDASEEPAIISFP